MDPPIIIVSDFGESPPLTTRYVNGDNELDLETVYGNVSRLCDHPGRGRLEMDAEGGGNASSFHAKFCDQHFLDTFWQCASDLCDYLADFVNLDSADMRSVWFHLLDKLHEAAVLPHQYWLTNVPFCDHSEQFCMEYRQLHTLIMFLIMPKMTFGFGDGIYIDHLRMRTNPGSIKAGLQDWQQFLYNESPGFAVPTTERVYLDAAQSAPSSNHTTSTTLIPHGGLALVKRHTERLRTLTEIAAQGELDVDSPSDVLDDFDRNSLKIDQASTYTSIDGRQKSISPMHPNPDSEQAPFRHPDFQDPFFMSELPDFCLLNECVGLYKGREVFRQANDNGHFQMLELGSLKALPHQLVQSKMDPAAFSEMYDEWTSEG